MHLLDLTLGFRGCEEQTVYFLKLGRGSLPIKGKTVCLMASPKFSRPKIGITEQSSNLYVANCGPAVGLSYDSISLAFRKYGDVKGVYAADDTGARVIVCFSCKMAAASALEDLNGRPCPLLGNRTLHIRFSVQSTSPTHLNFVIPVSLTDSELDIPGVHLLHDFVSKNEEEELLTEVDSRPWHHLAKRRVQHYGYAFCYDTRNVDTSKYLGELPCFVSPIIERISLFSCYATQVDQLTVNEYPVGVGLSPHIDTHSAFDDFILSLSLAGPCIMEFRKYPAASWISKSESSCDDDAFGCVRKAIYLPPRSMLLLSGEARYAWHHYIPHHKVDRVKDQELRRNSRRVSFTLRKVRKGPCHCSYPNYCDSQKSVS